MARNTGIDPLRGRPTPAVASTEEKIQRRKLDSLKRGIHRIKDDAVLPYRIHLVGIGGAGAAVVAHALSQLSDATLDEAEARVTALAIDISSSDGLDAVRRERSRISSPHAHIEVLQLEVPSDVELRKSLARYPEFLRLEYPLYPGGADFEPWLDESAQITGLGEHIPRAVAKAIYGRAYYDNERLAEAALRRFVTSVTETPEESLVCVCFGLGGGTGSGIVVDLARHLSNIRFGRRVLVAGVGIAPCEGDIDTHKGGNLYPVVSELDCMGDEAKNQGVVMACGDLYKNPFTAGFLLVPQQHVWEGSKDLDATHKRVDEEVASLITARNGANLWETLRLLNWVAAPTTQHSAARTPYGARWIHMFAFADVEGKNVSIDSGFRDRLGLLPTYRPEFIEARIVSKSITKREKTADTLNTAFSPVIEPEITGGGRADSVQFVLPQVRKTDLKIFAEARNAYDAQSYGQKVLGHAWLLERGVLLCEPSTRIKGMAGASLPGQNAWVAVPHAYLRSDGGQEQKAATEAV